LHENIRRNRYDKMIYRKCGKWGLKLPAISLGAWETFGGYRGEETARECMYRAFDLGITHFDLANNYGRPPGNAEIVVGHVLKEMPRDELIVSTKAGYHMWAGALRRPGARANISSPRSTSRSNGWASITSIFSTHHRPDPDTPLEETHRRARADRPLRQGALCRGEQLFRGAPAKRANLVERKNWPPDHHPPALLQHAGTQD
jgi:L-glyceraldehyde 3-phosphate reductase